MISQLPASSKIIGFQICVASKLKSGFLADMGISKTFKEKTASSSGLLFVGGRESPTEEHGAVVSYPG